MPDQLKHINVRGPFGHALLVLPLLLALTGAWFSVRWYVGNTIAEYMDPQARGDETARIAARLAPGDPLAHWRLGEVEQTILPQDQLGQAIKEFELAVRLSPNDYRFWLALGRALEQSGERQRGEVAMRRAVELAPAYSYPRWYLGNLLLRSGDDANAFAELRRASAADSQLMPQVFNLALQVYGKNIEALRKAIGSAAETRAQFAKYLLDSKRIDDGMQMWNSLDETEKKANRATGESMMKGLIEAKRFRLALDVWNDLAVRDSLLGAVDQLLNGGFEQDVGPASNSTFGWQVRSTQSAQVTVDSNIHHGGGHSLRLSFQSKAKADFGLNQLVIVQPDKQYDLEVFLRTRNLESAGTPIIEIVDAADGSIVGTAPPAPSGDNDWQAITITFKTSPKTEAIRLRLNRASCGDNPDCPVFGTLWYDDFNLKLRK